MKIKGLVTFILLCFFSKIIAEQPSESQSTLKLLPEIIDTDSILNAFVGTPVINIDTLVSQIDSSKIKT